MRGDVETYFEDGQWKNKVEGNERASSAHSTEEEATGKGRDMAIEHGVEHIIRNQDGKIGERNTYPRSHDPRDISG
ncbi:DUF2188 domain-containing protein [Lentzea alba]|uniref:DUF2188 domain-containing protein n=1 Tax=Lentzea alba TaxID=2714351 RepID=UPI0039BF1EBD